MAEAEPFSFHDTFVGILQQLDMLKHIHLMHTNVVENSSKITNGELTNSREEIAKSNTYIVNTSGEDTKQSSAVSRSNPSFRKRKRKQENDKICRLDIAKAEEEDVLENLKAEECKNFLKYFSLQLPTFVPNEGFVKESANLNDNLEVCKRLAGRAGRLIREKNAVLEEEWRRIGELEDALSKEQKLKEELRNELVVLQERVDAVRTAAREGFESNCLYCSSVFRELGEQEDLNVIGRVLKLLKTEVIASSEAMGISDAKGIHESRTPADLAFEEGLASNSGLICSEVSPLKPWKRELDGLSEKTEENVKKRRFAEKSNGLPKANENSQNDRVCMDSKSSSVFSEVQRSENMTELHLQREIKDNIEERTRSDGKELDIEQIHANVGVAIECRKDGNVNEEEDGAVESKESHPKIPSTKVIEEELDRSTEDLGGMGVIDGNDLAKLSELEKGCNYIEMKCGCTSLKHVDTLGVLRVYDSGLFEVYCECMTGCDKGKPMTPAAFERHGGCGANGKWKGSIWILVGEQKVQLSKAKILEPYYQKYKAMKNLSQMENIKRAYNCDAFIPFTKFCKKPRLKRRKKEARHIYYDARDIPTRECSNMPHDRSGENFLISEKDSCSFGGDGLQKRKVCYNLRSR